MSTLKVAALAAALTAGMAVSAGAQSYGGWQDGRGYGHYRPQPQVWVPPKVARKQAELSERFVEKYGLQPRVYSYSRPYGGPRHWRDDYPVYVQPRQRMHHPYGW